MDKHYESADIFLNCSLHDSGCMVILEAMSHGLPVVCVKTGGPAEIVTSDTGTAVEPCKYDTLVIGIQTALRELVADPEMRLAKGRRGLKRVYEEFQYDCEYKKFLNLVCNKIVD